MSPPPDLHLCQAAWELHGPLCSYLGRGAGARVIGWLRLCSREEAGIWGKVEGKEWVGWGGGRWKGAESSGGHGRTGGTRDIQHLSCHAGV